MLDSMDLSFSNDPFHLHRDARIETITASNNFKDSNLTFNTYHGHQSKPHPITIQASEPFEEHPHSYNHGSLPTFIPNRHARHFRQEKERAPSSLDTYIVDSSQDTMREAKGRRSRTPRGGRRAGSRMSNMSNVTKAPICRIDAHARPGRGMSGIILSIATPTYIYQSLTSILFLFFS